MPPEIAPAIPQPLSREAKRFITERVDAGDSPETIAAYTGRPLAEVRAIVEAGERRR